MAGERVLLVHDDPTPTANDTTIQGILTGAGMTVSLQSESAAPPTDTTTYDVVVHTESGSSTSTAITAYPTMAVPLVYLETSWNNINMATAAATNPTSTTQYDIIATSHPIVAGLSDPFTWRTGASGNYGVTTAQQASGTVQVCAPVGNTAHSTVLTADTGATLTTGTAPARRVCSGIGVGSAPASWTADANTLLIQMVQWAANLASGPNDGTGTGTWTFTGTAFGSNAPATPQNLDAVAVSGTQVNLTWDAVPGATGYDIERDGVVIVQNHGTNSYSDTGRTPATLYTYRVRAVGA